jgi:predicted ATPase
MITKVRFHRFKQFRDHGVAVAQQPITLVAGANNAGKSSLLHGLAVWEFCRTVIEAERGPDAFAASPSSAKRQGIGLGAEEFSPINIPSLNHLWTNLRTSKQDEPDGYTLRVGCTWEVGDDEKDLEFGLALANDRLFVRTTSTNLEPEDRIPRLAYLPPFAGITAREMRLTGAIRRRRIGEGVAGAVLRNLLLDMYQRNTLTRQELRGDRRKLLDRDLRRLRESDPWELLQGALRETFSAELDVSDFSEEYHSYIRVEVVKGDVDGFKLKRWPKYNKRDLMVEGSGFLQWLSVYTLATNPEVDVLLLDEPDAHLHTSLQTTLLGRLQQLAAKTGKQVLVATHASEILRYASPGEILEIRNGKDGQTFRYLQQEHQKVGLLAGLGSDYAPRIDRIQRTRRLLFVEGTTDPLILKALAAILGRRWDDRWIEWCAATEQKERKNLFLALCEEIPGLVAVSLRDRGDTPAGQVGSELEDKTITTPAGLDCRRWRRRNIESYLLWPPAIAEATGRPESAIRTELADHFALAIGSTFAEPMPPAALLDADGKNVLQALLGGTGATVLDVAKAIPPNAVCHDIVTFLDTLVSLGPTLASVPGQAVVG